MCFLALGEVLDAGPESRDGDVVVPQECQLTPGMLSYGDADQAGDAAALHGFLEPAARPLVVIGDP
jgi:hypothetical protein